MGVVSSFTTPGFEEAEKKLRRRDVTLLDRRSDLGAPLLFFLPFEVALAPAALDDFARLLAHEEDSFLFR